MGRRDDAVLVVAFVLIVKTMLLVLKRPVALSFVCKCEFECPRSSYQLALIISDELESMQRNSFVVASKKRTPTHAMPLLNEFLTGH